MPYNRLISIGDSFTRGDELADCPVNDPRADDYSNSTWPALLAKQLNLKYHSRSKGGIGNQWISWKASAGCKRNTLYVINWTFFERFKTFCIMHYVFHQLLKFIFTIECFIDNINQ